MPHERTRLVVLGLDGLPFSLARRLCLDGRLPNLARAALAPGARALRAELPELSPVNWTSFMTGAGPEEHGVFGFTRIDPVSYEIGLTDFSQVATPTVFDLLGRRGLYSKVVNLPNTFPARPFEGAGGVLVSGFVAQDFARAVHPPMLAAPLAAAGYRLEADTAKGATDPAFLLADLNATLDSRRAALNLFWPDLAWDVFVFVLTETDRLFHFLFPAVEDAAHPWHDMVWGFLNAWDRLIGEVLDRFAALPEPKRLLVLADHGFTALEAEFDLNAWLRREGLLQVPVAQGPDAELSAQGLHEGSKAFALDPGRVYIHSRERFARGRVDPAEAVRLKERLREALAAVRLDGRPVMAAVHDGAELYAGPHRFRAPDLVCEPVPGFDLKAKFNREEPFAPAGAFGRTGTHMVEDAFFYDSWNSEPTPEGRDDQLPEGQLDHLLKRSPERLPERLRDTGRLVLETFTSAEARIIAP